MHRTAARALVAIAIFAAVGTSTATARAGEATGVARVRVLRGDVEVVRADSGDTVAAAVNAPVAVGDEIATHAGARAEIELDYGTLVRIGPDSDVRFTKLERRDHVVQVALGTVEVRVFHERGERTNVESPQATLEPRAIGRYRATVASDGRTEFLTRSGSADVAWQSGTQTLATGKTVAVTGSYASPKIVAIDTPESDAFDRWGDARDEAIASTQDGSYVAADMIGAEDLGTYGRWIEDPRYGRVWSPYVDAGWAPYHDGRFVWEPYYGWTWVGAEPWGWAPYHYGNWFYGNEGWAWDPGAPLAFAQPFVYRPAVVAFFSFGGLPGFDLGFGNIGWVPLAPFEPYYPWYGGYTNVTNVTTVANASQATNNLRYTIYHNVRAPGGFVAVDRSNFTSGKFGRVDTVSPRFLAHATIVRGVLPVVPTAKNFAFANHPNFRTSAAPAGAFAKFSPPAYRVEPFVREQKVVGDIARTTYPSVRPLWANGAASPHRVGSAPIARRAAPVSIVRAIPVERAARTTPIVIDGARATRTTHAIVIDVPGEPNAERAPSSPWDRFRGRDDAAHAVHVLDESHSPTTRTPLERSTPRNTAGTVRTVPVYEHAGNIPQDGVRTVPVYGNARSIPRDGVRTVPLEANIRREPRNDGGRSTSQGTGFRSAFGNDGFRSTATIDRSHETQSTLNAAGTESIPNRTLSASASHETPHVAASSVRSERGSHVTHDTTTDRASVRAH